MFLTLPAILFPLALFVNRKAGIIVLLLSGLISGLRVDVGADYQQYVYYYKVIDQGLNDAVVLNKEFLPLVIMKVGSLLSWGPQFFFLTTSLYISITLAYAFVLLERINIKVGTLTASFLLLLYPYSLTGVRQACAIATIFLACALFLNRKNILALCTILLSIFWHLTGVFGMVVVVLVRYPLPRWKLALSVIAVTLLAFFGTFIDAIEYLFVQLKLPYFWYFEFQELRVDNTSLSRTIAIMAIILSILVSLTLSDKHKLLKNGLFLFAAVKILSIDFQPFSRLANYSKILLVIGLAEFLTQGFSRQTNLKIVKITLIAMMWLLFLFRVHNEPELVIGDIRIL